MYFGSQPSCAFRSSANDMVQAPSTVNAAPPVRPMARAATPASLAALRMSSSSWAVRTNTRALGRARRMRRVASRPSNWGMPMSITTTSAPTSCACWIAALPSLAAVRGGGFFTGSAHYAASKAAVVALTVALAEEVAKDGVLVNAVAPSIMDTPANRKAMPDADHATWPKVDEVAATILFLASPGNAVTRGGIVPVYGRT